MSKERKEDREAGNQEEIMESQEKITEKVKNEEEGN